jgi:hypothetical protein
MRERLRRHLGTILVALVVASVASGGTAIAIVANAHKVDGYHANQLVRATQKVETSFIDNFDSGSFTPVVSKSVTAPRKGVLVISAWVTAEWDIDSADTTAALTGRVAVDGSALAPLVRQVLVDEGTYSGAESMAWSVAVPVSKGSHPVILQLSEDSSGMAFITERGLTIMFVPFGNGGGAGVGVGSASLASPGESQSAQ